MQNQKILFYYSYFLFINVIRNITPKAGFLFGDHEVGVLPVDSDLQHYLDLKRMPGCNEIQDNDLRKTLLNVKNKEEENDKEEV